MLFGWQTIEGNKYYLNTTSGEMKTGWMSQNGKKYYFSVKTGIMQTGYLHLGNYYYYLDTKTGAMLTGWQTIPKATVSGTKRVYFNTKGKMLFGTQKISNMWYKFNTTSGELITTGAVKIAIVDTAGQYKRAKAALEKAGASVTVFTSADFNVKKYDGLVIPGGADVTPSLYGESYAGARGCNYSLDKIQIAVINKFLDAGKPILGVCRGCQILNVAFGGTLYQDITGHRSVYTKTTISGGLMKYMYGSALSDCRCSHHQCPKKIGSGLIITQKAADGRVEAIEHSSKPIYGVQWHPENSGTKGQKVYDTFVKICRAWK